MMAIQIGILESIFVLIFVVLLTTVIVWWYWQRRLANVKNLNEGLQAAEVHDLIKDFKHQASHCLRPIKDNLYLIKKKLQMQPDTNTSNWHQFVGNSLHNIEKYEWRLTRLIENMSFVSRLEAKAGPGFRFADVKIDVIVSDLVSDFQNSAGAKGILLNWWARPENFPPMMANEESLRQVFINLIDNAIKYCEKDDEITISLEANERKKRIFANISDTGAGIPEEDWEDIFKKSTTVEGKRGRPPREGSQGLGLYIAQLVVEKHQGKIAVTSELGVGTTFTIKLPIQRV